MEGPKIPFALGHSRRMGNVHTNVMVNADKISNAGHKAIEDVFKGLL